MIFVRIFLLLASGVVGFWAGGLAPGPWSIVVQVSALGIFAINLVPLIQEFSKKNRRSRFLLNDGELSSWHPAAIISSYLSIAMFGGGIYMILTALRPRGHSVDVELYFRYGVFLAALGLAIGVLVRLFGRRG